MYFRHTTGWEDGIAALTQAIVSRLARQQAVLWLVSGGSNIPASVQVMASISDDLSKRLTVGLADERYGPVGHPDSNWQQLEAAGFDPKQAKVLPVLKDKTDLAATAQAYDTNLREAFQRADARIAQLGIGEDGHIAGILPGSRAAREATALAIGYETDRFTRLTMTFPSLRQLDMAYAFAFGNAKRAALERLEQEDTSLTVQPAQILKQIAHAYVYNDQIGEIT